MRRLRPHDCNHTTATGDGRLGSGLGFGDWLLLWHKGFRPHHDSPWHYWKVLARATIVRLLRQALFVSESKSPILWKDRQILPGYISRAVCEMFFCYLELSRAEVDVPVRSEASGVDHHEN